MNFDPDNLIYDYLRLEEFIMNLSTADQDRPALQVELNQIIKQMETNFWEEMRTGEFEMRMIFNVSNLHWSISIWDTKGVTTVTLNDTANALGRYMAMMWFFIKKHHGPDSHIAEDEFFASLY